MMDTLDIIDDLKGWAQLYSFSYASKDGVFFGVALVVKQDTARAVWTETTDDDTRYYGAMPAWFPDVQRASWMKVL